MIWPILLLTLERMETLTCPKCHGPMRTYERSGVTVDQCTECRGIFLDRGELMKHVSAKKVLRRQIIVNSGR